MLLPSGPVNTRRSVCRFDPGGLHVQLRPDAQGTGLQSPETGRSRAAVTSWHVSENEPGLIGALRNGHKKEGGSKDNCHKQQHPSILAV
jgi:hypothetical protein